MAKTEDDLSLTAEIRAAIGGIHSYTKYLVGRERAKIDRLAKKQLQPIVYTYSDVVIVSGANPAVIRLTGPDQGYWWFVRGICIADVTPAALTLPTAIAWALITAADGRQRTSLAQFSAVEIRDFFPAATSGPLLHQYSNEQMPLRDNEELYVAITGATNGHQLVATMWALNVQQGQSEIAWDV